jgi:hypothetical protein
MEQAVLFALVAILSFGLGLVAGARRMQSLYRQGRIIHSTAAALSSVFGEEVPRRSVADMLAGRVRVTIGGLRHEMPVLSRAESREWLASLDARLSALAAGVDAAQTDPAKLIPLLMSESDAMLDLLKSYDRHDVLPPRAELDQAASDSEGLRAVLEVWQAANPKAATGAPGPAMSGISPAPPTSSPTATAGAPSSWSN